MLTLTLIHLTETANKLFCRPLLEKCKGQICGGLDMHRSIQVIN